MSEDEISPDERMRMGKKGRLYTIEVLYHRGVGTQRTYWVNHYVNNTWAECMQFRYNVFEIGILNPIDKGHWHVVPPESILDITIERQTSFFEQTEGKAVEVTDQFR